MKKNGFTLVETMVAMFISMLVIFGVIAAYINGITLMKKSGRQIRAQQEAIVTMNKVCDAVRGSLDLEVFDFTPPNTWTESEQGNFLVIYSLEGETTAYYYVESKMFCVPSFSEEEFIADTKYLLASNLKTNTYFFEDSGNIKFNLEITDSDDTNLILFSSTSIFTSRN